MSRSQSTAADTSRAKKRRLAPGESLSVEEIVSDTLTPIAQKYWSQSNPNIAKYDPRVIEDIYYNELINSDMGGSSVVLLDMSSYLEYYIWKNFDASNPSYAQVMSAIIMINEKFRDNVNDIWSSLLSIRSDGADTLFAFLRHAIALPYVFPTSHSFPDGHVLANTPSSSVSKPRHSLMLPRERCHYITFLTSLFTSLENDTVRAAVLKLCSLPLWRSLSAPALEKQLETFPEFAGAWRKLSKQKVEKTLLETTLLPHLIHEFLYLLARTGVSMAQYASGKPVPEENLIDNFPEWLSRSMSVGYGFGESTVARTTAKRTRGKYGKGKGKGKYQKKGRGNNDADDSNVSNGKGAALLSSRALAVLWIADNVCLLERTVVFFTELCAQLPTRRFAKPLLEDSHVVSHAMHSVFVRGRDTVYQQLHRTITVYDGLCERARELKETLRSAAHDGKKQTPKIQQDSDSDSDSESDSSESESDSGSDSDKIVSESDSDSDDDTVPAATATETGAKNTGVADLQALTSRIRALRRPRATAALAPSLLIQLLSSLYFYLRLPCHEQTGATLARAELEVEHTDRVTTLQRKAYVLDKALFHDLHTATVAKLSRMGQTSEKFLSECLVKVPDQTISELLSQVGIIPEHPISSRLSAYMYGSPAYQAYLSAVNDALRAAPSPSLTVSSAASSPSTGVGTGTTTSVSAVTARHFAVHCLTLHVLWTATVTETADTLPIFPSEELIWDFSLVPPEIQNSGSATSRPLALPRLGLQFLNTQDYILRNFHLYRQESAYEIRMDIEEAVSRMAPRLPPTAPDFTKVLRDEQDGTVVPVSTGNSTAGSAGAGVGLLNTSPEALQAAVEATTFTGKSPYALPLLKFAIQSVKKARVGSRVPAKVTGELTIDLGRCVPAARAHWQSIQAHNVLFLLSVVGKPVDEGGVGERRVRSRQGKASAASLGLLHVRGAEVICVKDESGKVIGERDAKGRVYEGRGTLRTYIVSLDAAQYYHDMLAFVGAEAQTSAATVGEASANPFNAANFGTGMCVPTPARHNPQLLPLSSGHDVYASFNLVMRRNAEENNFKSVLAAVKALLCDNSAMPGWLRDVYLGFGAPDAAAYYQLQEQLPKLKFADTFVDEEHLRDSFLEPVVVRVAEEEEQKDEGKTGDVAGEEEEDAKKMETEKDKVEEHTSTSTSTSASASASPSQPPYQLDFTATVTFTERRRPDPAALRALFARNRDKYRRGDYGATEAATTTTATATDGADAANAASADAAADAAGHASTIATTDAAAANVSGASEVSTSTTTTTSTSGSSSSTSSGCITATPYPWIRARDAAVRRNTVRFTPTQVEAIRSGVNPGLTVIVGPPGTGKTDTAVQILSELHHNFPHERVLVVTHSNHALNDVFRKVLQRDVDERYMLRLGHNQDNLDTQAAAAAAEAEAGVVGASGWQQAYVEGVDFSKFGRVNYMLQRRLQLLAQVSRLAEGMGAVADVASSCETAWIFFTQHVQTLWRQYAEQVLTSEQAALGTAAGGVCNSDGAEARTGNGDGGMDDSNNAAYSATAAAAAAARTAPVDSVVSTDGLMRDATEAISARFGDVSDNLSSLTHTHTHTLLTSSFPFLNFFSRDGTLFAQQSYVEDKTVVLSCWNTIHAIFTHLHETQPFELLRSYQDRADYLLSRHAKVVAMTCTHAAIQREEFLRLALRYDTIIMEEAGQVLDIETFIPMFLQHPDREFGNRLKRVVLLGDHQQLPPVVQNMAIQRYSRLDQSLFTRFVKLGMPVVQLNAQGRMRPSLAQLWNWRYDGLMDIPLEHADPRFSTANTGFACEWQFIDVNEWGGESSPQPHFIQNLAEAEYVVHTYMYMRLMGYPKEKISILTMYNGQKALLMDVLNTRCAQNPLYGMPAAVSTVDKYQGQQNDYVLLSLVRTKQLGHVRDIRRMTVALSRARLGLYVFGRAALMQDCFELAHFMAQLLSRATKLQLCPEERNPYGLTSRPPSDVCDLVRKFNYERYMQEATAAAAHAARAEAAGSDDATVTTDADADTTLANAAAVPLPSVMGTAPVAADPQMAAWLQLRVFAVENLEHMGTIVGNIAKLAESEYQANLEYYTRIAQEEAVRQAEEAAERRRRAEELQRAMEEEERLSASVARQALLDMESERYEAEMRVQEELEQVMQDSTDGING